MSALGIVDRLDASWRGDNVSGKSGGGTRRKKALKRSRKKPIGALHERLAAADANATMRDSWITRAKDMGDM